MRIFIGYNDKANIVIILLAYCIILVQIIIDVILSRKKEKKLPLLEFERYSVIVHYVNIILFSSVLFLANAFLFLFTQSTPLSSLVLIVTSLLYYLLYLNIHSDRGILNFNFKYQYHHNSLYDAVKIYLFFLLAYDIFHIWAGNILYQCTALFVVSILILFLVIHRYKQLNIHGIIYIILLSIIISAFSYLFLILSLFPLIGAALLSTVLFYLSITFFHYKMEGIIQKKTILEHTLFVVIIVLVIFFTIY